MSFVQREFPDIVRDILTNLTQGVTREAHQVNYDAKARVIQVPDIVLQRRPVRRVSFVSGFIAAPKPDDPPVPHTFSLNDYELAPSKTDAEDLNTIRFLPFGRKPAPGTDIIVNYYPRSTDKAVVNDLNVGSVVRTLMEAVSKELAILYSQLNLAYDAGYLDTATGVSLNRVVALLGYERFRAGRAVGAVTFTRRAGSPGSITIPAGTPITDTADKIRYETSETHEMLAGESTAQVRVRGSSEATPPVDAGKLVVIQRAIAGVDKVVNERPTTRASDDESDVELRARTRVALLGSNNGTNEAIAHGLLQMPEVRDVKITEMPNGVPGEISVAVSLVEPPSDPAKLPAAVLEKIESLRPAGIRVLSASAGSVALQAMVKLVLAGSAMAPAEIEQVHGAARNTLIAEIRKKGVGEKIRVKPLTAALLADQRIADATVTIGEKGSAPAAADFETPAGSTVHIEAGAIAFEADDFDKPPPETGQTIAVEVTAKLTATPLAGVSADDAKAAITTKLKQFFGAIAPGTTLDSVAVLNAIRDDTKYGIDPLKMTVTLTADDQFVQILQGGPAFTAKPLQVFNVVSVELTP